MKILYRVKIFYQSYVDAARNHVTDEDAESVKLSCFAVSLEIHLIMSMEINLTT